MFKSKKKQKTEISASASDRASLSYNESTQVQTSNDGKSRSTIITRQISSQSSQIRNTQERIVTVQHSSSTGNVPDLMNNSLLPSRRIDAFPFRPGTGSISTTSPAGSRLPAITFGTSSVSPQPRNSFSYSSSRSPISNVTPYRSAFSSTTFGSYPSRSGPSPLASLSTQNAAQNPTIAQSLPAPKKHLIPTYDNICSKRGKALIINNIKFIDKKDERKGAEKDSKDLIKVLKTIGFEVVIKTDMKGKEMLKKVEQFSKSNFSSYDMSLVVIMSHGNNIVKDGEKIARVKGGYTEIAGIDNVPLLVDDIIEKFTANDSHSSLKGKPKIFMFQCCRGENDQEVCHDAAPINKVLKQHSDILIAFSTLPGFISNRNPLTGSWYIQTICEVFEKHYKDFHIEEMLKIVDDQLSRKHPLYTQTSTYESRGFKRCYLYPQPDQ